HLAPRVVGRLDSFERGGPPKERQRSLAGRTPGDVLPLRFRPVPLSHPSLQARHGTASGRGGAGRLRLPQTPPLGRTRPIKQTAHFVFRHEYPSSFSVEIRSSRQSQVLTQIPGFRLPPFLREGGERFAWNREERAKKLEGRTQPPTPATLRGYDESA